MLDVDKQPIIIVEDEPATRKLLLRQLERAGYEVSAYGDGRAALEPIASMNSGIVLADWSMPEMDGPELCRAIRELEDLNALNRVYFILLTAHNSKEKVIEGLEAGANDYLTKPYHQGELLARIQVGERILRLQHQLLKRTIEFHKANSQLALMTRKLEEMANTDALTGLPNRRCVLERFEETWQQTLQNKQPYCCTMLDIDKFKSINDTYGHDAGDHVLQQVAQVIRSASRRPENCGRLGGEEFVVLHPQTELDVALEQTDKLRQQIADLACVHNDVPIDVRISCGVAVRGPEATTTDEALKRADSMLYHAKENGRNQVWVCDADGQARRYEPQAQPV